MTELVWKLLPESEWDAYDQFVEEIDVGSVLQTSAWGRLKAHTGWEPMVVGVFRGSQLVGGTLILSRAVPVLGAPIWYSPRGPLVEPDNADVFDCLVDAARELARQRGAIVWKIDPDWRAASTTAADLLESRGFRACDIGKDFEGVQPKFVMHLPLADQTPDGLLKSMHKKTRYNIRLAARRGVQAFHTDCRDDVARFYDILQVTADRDEFGIRDISYYYDLFDEVLSQGWGALFLATYEDHVLAGAVALRTRNSVWYLYGATSNEYRELMPAYGLQWEMIQWAAESGVPIYDFRGVSGDLDPDNPLYGLYRFKKGFNADLVELVGEYDLVFRPIAYRFWKLAEAAFRFMQRFR